jgi:hypothetical protein
MTCAELCAKEPGTDALLRWDEFLKMVERMSGKALNRRLLQFYSSPELRLVPLPIYARRHTAHYLHPEDTRRLALVLHLRTKYFLPFKILRKVLAELSPEHYDLVHRDAFTAEEISRLGALENRWPLMRELIFKRVHRLLRTAHAFEKYGEARLPEGRDSQEALDAFRAWLDARPSLRPSVAGKELECARA